jgi:hypothetical protein
MVQQQFIKQQYQHQMDNKRIYLHQECNIQVNISIRIFLFNLIFLFSTVVPAIDSNTGLQLQPGTAYTTLPAQYPIYTPTAIYSHLPTTTLIPSALASPGKEG